MSGHNKIYTPLLVSVRSQNHRCGEAFGNYAIGVAKEAEDTVQKDHKMVEQLDREVSRPLIKRSRKEGSGKFRDDLGGLVMRGD